MMKKWINKFLNKKSDFTKDDELRSINEQLYYIFAEERKLLNYAIKENIKYYIKHKKAYIGKLLLVGAFYASLLSSIIFGSILLLDYFKFVNVTIPKQERVVIYKTDSTMNLKNYLIQIAYGESRYIVDSHRDGSTYYGIFQIGENERSVVGYGDISNQVFLKHEDIQVLVMIKLLKLNKKTMQKHIDKYSGKIVDGILITESGILALCQLGCGSTQKWLDSGTIPAVDDFGNKPRDLIKIGGYRLDLDKMDDNIISVVKNLK